MGQLISSSLYHMFHRILVLKKKKTMSDGNWQEKCLKLQCELQESNAMKDAYTKKLKEGKSEIDKIKSENSSSAERIRQLEGTISEEKDRSKKLEATLNEFMSEKQHVATEAQEIISELKRRADYHAGGNHDHQMALLQRDEEICVLKEEISDLRNGSDNEVIARLEAENMRLIDTVMEMKRNEAETMNDINEHENIVRKQQRRSESPKSEPSSPGKTLEDRIRKFLSI